MNTYSLTYWPPATGANVMTVNAHEFAFTETHVIFLNGAKMVTLAMPLTLQPIVRYVGPVAGAA